MQNEVNKDSGKVIQEHAPTSKHNAMKPAGDKNVGEQKAEKQSGSDGSVKESKDES